MHITTFVESDFRIFDLDGFDARMPAIRKSLTPKLKRLGDELALPLSERLQCELHPHVAMHMRRTVNPPEETWVAFGRSKRSYKPFIHFRTVVNANGVFALVFLEDEAGDKQVFAENLLQQPNKFAVYFKRNPSIRSFDLRHANGTAKRGSDLDSGVLSAFAQRLANIKAQHASFGIPIAASEAVDLDGNMLASRLIDCFHQLMPLYNAGLSSI